MKKIFLLSDDLLLIGRWMKSINYQTEIVENIEETLDIKNAILIMNTGVSKDISTKLIKEIIGNQNEIIVLDNIPNFLNAKKFLELGIKGYGNTLMTKSYLNSAVEAVSNNYIWLIPQVTTQLLKVMSEKNDSEIDEEVIFKTLTKTEKTIANLLKEGYSNMDITKELEISINTVKTHIKHIYEKLNVKDRLSFAGLFTK
ncbi:response regulator transcription factor [Poseidonibacter lekithochrous]|uniref:response regulator transcription factor n=1 Tax=Poseidonibacter TaxID=2321187 RepID=UPI001C09FF57|nr:MULTISPECIES: response regulator transcription factor [Poseidonibacter]MBU3014044.1 response regulator transcription factor [Poseidonibacter lekithochrous]MDO6827340.1 response regulator transcription factor [Poseidonibacter sp. 1_MG-2023]